MPKKKPLKLPQVGGSTSRRSSYNTAAGGESSWHPGDRQRQGARESIAGQSWRESVTGQSWRGASIQLESPGETSPIGASKLSQAEAKLLSDSIDASISLSQGLAKRRSPAAASDDLSSEGGLEESEHTGDEWEVQSPEEILKEVRRAVLQRKPLHREEDLDDTALERRRRSERELRGDGGIHIILPDNRVRAVEDQLGSRVRAELLGEEVVEPAAPPLPRRPGRPDDGRPKGPRRHRNPWYLPATHWYNPEAQKDPNAERGGGFPYDSQILRGEEAESALADDQERDAGGGGDGDGPVRALTRRDKETLQIIDAYKQYMKGHRLPHFLQ